MKIQADSGLCRGCEACALACSLLHEGLSNPLLSRVLVKKDMARFQFQLIICEQCDTPECVEACPNQAIRFDERRVVMIYEEECLHCGACAEACPYGAIFYHPATDRYIKCDVCAGLPGPACVEICPVSALALKVDAGASRPAAQGGK